MKSKYHKLAQIIRLAGKRISIDSIAKYYSINATLGLSKQPNSASAPMYIEVTDDSGYRSILLGDPYATSCGCGRYVLLYTENSDDNGNFTYRCFPSIKIIEARLKAIAKKQDIYVDKGPHNHMNDMVAYDYDGVMKAGRWSKSCDDVETYFAEIVEIFANAANSDSRSAEEIVV